VHQREYAVAPGGIEIRDTIVGRGRHSVKLFTHLHPDYSAVIASADNNICLVVDRRQRVVARIAFASSLNATRLRVERTPYFDQFGVNQRRDSIVIAGEVTLPCSLFGRIEPARTP
jgi:hypothetical protein